MLAKQQTVSGAILNVATYAQARPEIGRMFNHRSFSVALQVLLRLRERLGPDPDLVNDMATCYWQLGDQKKALELMTSIATSLKTNPLAWRKLASMWLSFGDRDAVRKCAMKCLKYDPNDLQALTMLDRVKPFKRGAKEIVALRKRAETGRMTNDEFAEAYNLLAKIEERAGDLDQAMMLFERSKEFGEQELDARKLEEIVTRQKETFQGARPELAQDEGPNIVFVVGLPRTGTTLLESVLVCHEKVQTLGESNALQRCLDGFCHSKQLQKSWDWVDAIGPEDINAVRAEYLRRFNLTDETAGSTMLLDKTPMNLLNCGFASVIFPKAKFVYMSRNPLDVGLSNMKTNFSAPLPFTRDWASMAVAVRATLNSALDYEEKLGAAFRWQSYEGLVTAHEANIRRVLEFLDLEWDERCLHPEQRSDAVTTASMEQVREKVNTKGLGKWTRYEAQLEPFIEALGGRAWLDEWTTLDRSRQEGVEPPRQTG